MARLRESPVRTANLLLVLTAAFSSPQAAAEALRPVVTIVPSGEMHLRACVLGERSERQVQSMELELVQRHQAIPLESWAALTMPSGRSFTCFYFSLADLPAGRYHGARLVGREEEHQVGDFSRSGDGFPGWIWALVASAAATLGGLTVVSWQRLRTRAGAWRRRATPGMMEPAPQRDLEERHGEWDREEGTASDRGDSQAELLPRGSPTSDSAVSPEPRDAFAGDPAGKSRGRPAYSDPGLEERGAMRSLVKDAWQGERRWTDGQGLVEARSDGRPLQRLAGLAESWWHDRDSNLEALASVAVRQSVRLFEWADFSAVLRTTAPSTVPLRFRPWHRDARGPAFLGAQESPNTFLHIVPTSARAFGSDQGLSALRALFDLHPEPRTKVFDLVAVRRPCRLKPHGDHYRLDAKGQLQTDQGTASPYRNPAEPAAPTLAPSERDSAPDVEGVPLPELRAAIRDDFDRFSATVLEQVRSGFAESWRRHDQVAEGLRALVSENSAQPGISSDQPERLADELSRRLVPRLEAALSSALLAASAPALPLTGALLTEGGSKAPEELRWYSPAEVAPPSAATVAPDPFSWLHRLLEHLDLRETGQARQYLEALRDLRTLVSRQDRAADFDVTYFRVSSEAETCFSLHEVWLEADAEQGMRVRKKDDSWLSPETVWQVFLGVFPADRGGGPVTPVALIFPWSRLEKGAPVVARSLVDSRRSGALAEFVRCVQPAILEWRSGECSYVAVNKLVVRPLGASSGS